MRDDGINPEHLHAQALLKEVGDNVNETMRGFMEQRVMLGAESEQMVLAATGKALVILGTIYLSEAIGVSYTEVTNADCTDYFQRIVRHAPGQQETSEDED